MCFIKVEIHRKAHAHKLNPVKHGKALKQRASVYKQEEKVEGRQIGAARCAHRHICAKCRIPVIEKGLGTVQHIIDMIIERRYLLRHIIVIDRIAPERINPLNRKDNAIDYKCNT